jgi:hypothetical protein
MAHWFYTISAVTGPCWAVLFHYLLRAFFLLQGARPDDERRSRQWFEAARLMRRDAKHINSYLPDFAEASKPHKAVPSAGEQRRRRISGNRQPGGSAGRIAS